MNVSFRKFWDKWGIKAGLSIADQGIFSGANFILNILLARSLSPSEYGIFAITFSVFLFLTTFQQAIILEPMSVIGSAYYRETFNQYMKAISFINMRLMFVLSAILVFIAVIMKITHNLLALPFFGLALSAPLILFFWFFQRVCYIRTMPGLALKSSLLYTLLLFFSLVILQKLALVSPFSALLAMGFASIAAAFSCWRYLGVQAKPSVFSKVEINTKDILRDNWRYGKWVAGSAFVNWLSTVVYLPLIGVFAGYAGAGVFKAMQNMTLPIQRIITASGLLLLPIFSRERVLKGESYLKSKIHKLIWLALVFSGGCVVLLVLFARQVINLFYGQSYYANFIWLLYYLGPVAIIESVAYALFIGLKAVEMPNLIFWTQVIGAGITLSLGIFLIREFNILGAAWASLLTGGAMLTALLLFLKHNLKDKCAE